MPLFKDFNKNQFIHI